MAHHYSDTKKERDAWSLPDVETFQLTAHEVAETMEEEIYAAMKLPEFRLASMNGRDREKLLDYIVEEHSVTGGWFYWYCFPGCLPEGSPFGPYKSQRAALAAARAEAGE